MKENNNKVCYIIKRIGPDNIYSDYFCGINSDLTPIFKIDYINHQKYNNFLEAEKKKTALENFYFNKGLRGVYSFNFIIKKIKNKSFSSQKIISRFELMDIE